MATKDETVGALNALLRGELSATETYQQAMEKVKEAAPAAELRRLHEEHREAANSLRQHVHHHGSSPNRGSGPWGNWAKLVEGAAKLFGETAALKALKEGEEHGLKSYEKALTDDSLADDCKGLIRSTLLPKTREHITALDRLMSAKA